MGSGRQAKVGAAAFLAMSPTRGQNGLQSQPLSQFSRKGPFCAVYLFARVERNSPFSPPVSGK